MTWLILLLVLGASQIIFKRWSAHVSYRVSLGLPIVVHTFEVATDESVPADTREILGERTAPLLTLGFERLGFLRSEGVLSGMTQTRIVLRHPTEGSFAVIGFGLLSHDLGIAVDVVTLLEDGSWVSTGNTPGRYRVADLPQARYVEAPVSTFAALLATHRDAVAAAGTAASVAVDFPAVARHLSFVESESARLLVARGEALPTDDPARFRRTPASARQRSATVVAAAKRAPERSNASGEFGTPRIPLEEQERMYEEASLGLRLRREASRPRLAFVVSAGAFAASLLAFDGQTWLALLMPAVLFHELGHWSVMRLFGHDDAAITFIPFLGAATTSHKPFSSRWREVLMLLAGPMPGIILGTLLLMASVFQGWPLVSDAGLLLVGLNVFNLLPLNPLDGGRVLHVLATAGRPVFDLALKLLASLVFLAGSIWMNEPVLGVLGGLGFLMLRSGYRSSALEIRVRRAPGFDVGLSPRQRRAFIFTALAEPPVRRFRTWLEAVTKLEVQLRQPRTPLWQTLFWTSAFGAVLGGFAFLIVDVAEPIRMREIHRRDQTGTPQMPAACPRDFGAVGVLGDAWPRLHVGPGGGHVFPT